MSSQISLEEALRFCNIIDIRASFYIGPRGRETGWVSTIVLYAHNEVIIYADAFIKRYFPDVWAKKRRDTCLQIKGSKNVLPILVFIKDHIYFKKKQQDCLYRFIMHRTSRGKKRFSSIDDEFKKEMDKINMETGHVSKSKQT